jgi:hypothetical protein
MKRRVSTLTILIFGFFTGFCQVDSAFHFYFKGGELNSKRIEKLNTGEFEFNFKYEGEIRDTIRVNVNHKKGTMPYFQKRYIFNENPTGFTKIRAKGIKPGDSLMFVFYINGQQIVKSYFVASTMDQLDIPYYVDVYFVYNKDTLSTESYVIPTKLRAGKEAKHTRLEFDDPRQLPKNISIKFDDEVLTYEVHFSKEPIFHGKISLEYIDKKKLRAKNGFFKSIETTDLDTGIDGTLTHKNVF